MLGSALRRLRGRVVDMAELEAGAAGCIALRLRPADGIADIRDFHSFACDGVLNEYVPRLRINFRLRMAPNSSVATQQSAQAPSSCSYLFKGSEKRRLHQFTHGDAR